MSMHRVHIPRVLLSKTLSVVLVAVLIFFSVSLLREVGRKRTIQSNIQQLEQQLIALERDSGRLESLISYLKTDEFAELEAKKRLGMRKLGEQVVLVTDVYAASEHEVADGTAQQSNWNVWWQLFFN